MNAVCTPTRPSHSRTDAAVNSGPLSLRRKAGGPRSVNNLVSVSKTSSDRRRRSTSMARHSREYSSITVSIRMGRPSWVRSATKS